jgi:putative ABC transport system ATP-binding protein
VLSETKTAITITQLCKVYRIEDIPVEVLKEINLNVQKGQFVAIYGPSGAGKTTLLNLISGIDKPTTGRITVFDQEITKQNEDSLADYRCNQVGFVFQSYNLISTLTVAENIAFPMEWKRMSSEKILTRVTELIQKLGLTNRANHFPAQLSGGEQQRVAFARALANDPALVLADEPTGNLDTKNGQKMMQILQSLKNEGKTIIVATHDEEIMLLADLKLYLEDGKLAIQHD